MQISSDKKRKMFNLSILKKPFSKNIPERSVVLVNNYDGSTHKVISNEENDKCAEVISNRSRTQRLIRSIKKKFERNKLLTFRPKYSISRFIPNSKHDISVYERNLEIADPDFHSLGKEHFNLAQHGWYWGPVSKKEAEEKLRNLPNGSFLVRDSSSDHHFYTLTYRADNSTLHTRINYSCGAYSLHEGAAYSSIADLIGENRLPLHQRFLARNHIESDSPILGGERRSFLTRANMGAIQVHLTFPLSRFNEVRTLQYLCRFVIRQYISVSNIEQLPVPASVQGYLVEGHY